MNNLKYIFFKELKEVFRDKKSLAMMLIVPIMIPVLVILLSFIFESNISKDSKYQTIGFTYKLDDVEKELLKKFKIKYIEKDLKDIKNEYKKDNISLYIVKNNNLYIMNGDINDKSTIGSRIYSEYFNVYKSYVQNNYLKGKINNINEFNNLVMLKNNLKNQNNFYGTYIVSYIFLFILMAITISATYPATDALAGEKERGTLETLLTFPIWSRDIIVGKYLSVSLASFITGIISLILMFISLYYVNDNFSIYKDIELIPNLFIIFYMILLIILYSLLISGLCILIASKAKSFKEAQSALTPITFIAIFPSMIAFTMGIKVSVITSLIPIFNFSVLFNDIVNGNFNYTYILLMLISNIIFIIIIIKLMIMKYRTEKILFS